MTRRALALVVLAACGAEPAPPSPPREPTPARPRRDVAPPLPAWSTDQDVSLLAIPERTTAAGDPLRGLAALAPVKPTLLGAPIELGDQLAGVLRVRTARRWCGTSGRDALGAPALDALAFVGLVHVTRPITAASPIHEGLPWDALAAMHHARTTATVWIDRHRRWYDAAIDVEVTGWRGPSLLFTTAILDDDVVVAVTVDGRPVWWQRIGYWLRVDGAPRTPTWKVHLQLRGTLTGAADWITAGAARLEHLLPVVPGQAPALDVTIHVPAGDRLDAGLPSSPAPSAPGWRGYRLRGRAERLDAVVQADRAPRSIDRGGVRWTAIGPPALDAALARAVDATAALGPPTERAVRLVTFEPGDRAHAPRAGTAAIALAPWSGVDAVADQHAIATAVAARWLAAAPDRTHQPCAWQDAAAAAIGLWSLDAAGARAVRARWAALAAAASPFRLRYPGPSIPEIRVELCARGALLWAALEERLGRAAIVDVLARLRAARPAAGWSDVAAAVESRLGGAPHAAWLRAWIERPLPPTIGVIDVSRDPGEIVATLRQNPMPPIERCDDFTAAELAIPPYRGPVTVAALAGTREVTRVEVDLALEPVRLRFTDPAITALVVDPDARLPLRSSPGLAVTVPPPR